MRRALLPPPADPEAAKFEQKLVEKLKYARDVLQSIKMAQGNAGKESISPDEIASTADIQ